MDKLIDPVLFLQQTVNFILLMILLSYVFYKPVRKVIDDRTKAIEDQIESAKNDRETAEKLRLDLEKRLAESRNEAKEYIDQAIKRGEQMKEDLLNEARAEIEKMKARAQKDIELEKEKAWAELKNNVAGLSFEIASKLVKESLDQEKHQSLINEAILSLDRLDTKDHNYFSFGDKS